MKINVFKKTASGGHLAVDRLTSATARQERGVSIDPEDELIDRLDVGRNRTVIAIEQMQREAARKLLAAFAARGLTVEQALALPKTERDVLREQLSKELGE